MLVPKGKLHTLSPLFAGVQETMVWSVLDGSMGKAFADDAERPACAALFIADFVFLAGEAEDDVMLALLREAIKPDKGREGVLAIPPSQRWIERLHDAFGETSYLFYRYATRKDTQFDTENLRRLAAALPGGYSLKQIDENLYHRCLADSLTHDFCGNFASAAEFLAHGIGFCAMQGQEIVGGASSYTFYKDGIEIEVDVHPAHQRKGIAAAVSAHLILQCLARGLYPGWDAANKESLALAQKLGYVPAGEYPTVAVQFPG